MERQEVYEAIDSEREYQEGLKQNDNRPDIIPEMHMGDILSAINVNMNKALFVWYSGSEPHSEAMTYLRKIAALCVKAGEERGMPSRNA